MQDFSIYFLGAEQPAWRTMLADIGVRNVGLSYWSVRRRLPKRKAYNMDWGFDSVFLDSGGYTANKEPTKHTLREWRMYAEEYAAFAQDHIDEIEMVTEFDCLALGHAWIQGLRREVWDNVPADKFMPVWHPEHGLNGLEELGERYERLAIAQDHISQPGLNITPYLNRLANKGVKLHGLAMSRPDAIRHVRFSSVSSTSWLSPMRFGETIIWDGSRLARYPTKMKAQARDRHRYDFEKAGFDIEKIREDDPREITRVSVWSWLQYEASVGGQGVTPSGGREVEGNPETDDAAVDTSVEAMRNSPPAIRVRDAAEMKPLPVFGYREVESIDTESNEKRRYSLPVVNSAPLRACNNCFVRTECPAAEENATCTFNIPIEIRTPAQRRAMLDGVVEMQGQRVAFMRFREELSGGYADPNLSQEIDRLMKIFSTIAELEDDRDFFKLTMEGRGKAGVLSRLFGKDAAESADTGPKLDPADTDRVLARVVRGEVTE